MNKFLELVITFWFNWRSNESISVKITCEFQINGFYKWKSQNWNVHVNNQSSPGFISWNQFFGIIFTKSQIIAIIFIRFVCTIKICITFVTVKDKNKMIWILRSTKFKSWFKFLKVFELCRKAFWGVWKLDLTSTISCFFKEGYLKSSHCNVSWEREAAKWVPTL